MALALHTAAREGNLEELRKLIATGCNLNEKDKHSRTPLHMASWAGHGECVQALLTAGADIRAAAMDEMSSMHFAAQQGHADVCRILLNAGTKVNTKTRKGTSALQFAAKKGHLSVVQLLIKRKANVLGQDRNGNTAMDLATDAGVKEVLQAAIDEAAQPQAISTPEAEPIGVPERPEAQAEQCQEGGEVPEAESREDAAAGIGPQEQQQPAKKRERGNMRKRGMASNGAGVDDGQQQDEYKEPAGPALPGLAEAPAAKRAHKAPLSCVGDEDDEDP